MCRNRIDRTESYPGSDGQLARCCYNNHHHNNTNNSINNNNNKKKKKKNNNPRRSQSIGPLALQSQHQRQNGQYSSRGALHFRGRKIYILRQLPFGSAQRRTLEEKLRARALAVHQAGLQSPKGEFVSKPKRLCDNKLGPAWVLGPEDRSNVETEIPNHVEIESIEPRPTQRPSGRRVVLSFGHGCVFRREC